MAECRAYLQPRLSHLSAAPWSNALVVSKMKWPATGDTFFARPILSTVFGEGADSLIFFPAGIQGSAPRRCHCRANRGADMPQDTLRDYNPFRSQSVWRYIKRIERLDTFDTDIRYSWW